jgi:hypothetical protein
MALLTVIFLTVPIITGISIFWGFIVGYVEMLALGVLHLNINNHIPALGFWSCVLLAWGLSFLMAILRPTVQNSKTE